MAITSIFLSFQCIIFVKNLKDYNTDIKVIRDKNYCNESLIIIENLIYEEMKEINVENNDIKIICKDNENKRIRFVNNSGKIVVDYYDKSGTTIKTANVIATNIRSMKADKKNNVIYISLTNKQGETVERCFGIKKVY